MANRLSEIPEFNVLILEAGGEENFISDVPLTPSVSTLTSKISVLIIYDLLLMDVFTCRV